MSTAIVFCLLFAVSVTAITAEKPADTKASFSTSVHPTSVFVQGWMANATSGFSVGDPTSDVHACLEQCQKFRSREGRCRMVSYNMETEECTRFTKASTPTTLNGFRFFRDSDTILAAYSEQRFKLLQNILLYGQYVMASEPQFVQSPDMCRDLCHVHPTCNLARTQMHFDMATSCYLMYSGTINYGYGSSPIHHSYIA